MKTKEELNALKEEVDTLNSKLAELTEEEMIQVTGGVIPNIPGVGLPFAKADSNNVIQEREGRLPADEDSSMYFRFKD